MPRHRIRWRERLFTDDGHLTLFGTSVYMDIEGAPRTQRKMHQHISACRRCAHELSRFKETIGLARRALFFSSKGASE